MYFLRVESKFSAALYLSNCDNLYKGMHGHDYIVTLCLKSASLNSCGMVYDYHQVQSELQNICSDLDNILLNDKKEFLEQNPTLENIAEYIYTNLISTLNDLPLFQVDVKHSKGVSASYRR